MVLLFRRSALWLGCAILTGGFLTAEEFVGTSARALPIEEAAVSFDDGAAAGLFGGNEADLDSDGQWIIDVPPAADAESGRAAGATGRQSEPAKRKPEPKRIHRVQRVTAYCDVGVTAAGTRSGVGQCAAPVDIPFGSKVYIPALRRTFVVTDRTDARFGRNTVDLFIPSEAACRQFGRRYLKCEYTVEPNPPEYGKLRLPRR